MLYLELVKYRLKVSNKKLKLRHIFKAYHDIALVHKTNEYTFLGISQLYQKELKKPKAVLSNPRNGYTEVKSDTLRLWIRDEIINKEKESENE